MPSSKRVSYSKEQKSFWVELFYDSDLTGKDAKQRFLRDVSHQADLKVGELYEKIKNQKFIQYHMLIHLEDGWVVAKESLQTQLNPIKQENNKARHAKFPELDDLVCDFINRSE